MLERKHDEYPRKTETIKPTYFPQIFTTWSREDLTISDDIKKPKVLNQPLYPRSLPKSHVRVNRHIHDFEKPKQNLSKASNSQSQESDHIYESLDDMKSTRNRQAKKKRSNSTYKNTRIYQFTIYFLNAGFKLANSLSMTAAYLE